MVLEISELAKPKGVWCKHCSTRQRCDIYDTRPKECRTFYCGWLTDPKLGDEWKPSRSKIIIVPESDGNRIAAHVHPSRPDAWRKEPFYSTLKDWAIAAAPHRGQVAAVIGRRTLMILPDRDVDLGDVRDDELIVTSERRTPFGIELDAFKMKRNDSRAQKLVPQGYGEASGAKRVKLGEGE
jgi:Fe-S-cluster containining protein